jgi:hypothetical protein
MRDVEYLVQFLSTIGTNPASVRGFQTLTL